MFELIEGRVNKGKIAAAPPEPLTFPLSFTEQRLWLLDQLEPGRSAYNVSEAMRFTGPLQVQSLERAINEIIQRHESLRTTFSLVDGRAMQIVAPSLHVGLEVSDLQYLPESERERVTASNAAELAGLPFDLQRGPLLRATLFVLRPDEHVLLLVMHHIVSEGGWSMSIFLREMGILYNAYSLSQPSPLPELPIQYGDYSVWQRDTFQGAVLEPHLSYWKYQLEGAPALIDWSADRQRPAAQTYRGARQSIFLPKELKDSLNVLCRKEGVTLFMTLLATFHTLLHRLTRQEDLIVGVPVAGRTPQTQGLIGLFLNTIALRLQPSGEVSFRQFVKQVRQVVFDGLAHQDLPFEVLVEAMRPDRNLAFTPLFQVMFAFQNAPRTDIELIGIKVTPYEVEIRSSMFDLTFFAWEKPDGLRIVFEYSTDLFEPTTIGRMLTQLQVLLEGIVRNPEEALSKLPLLTGAERQQSLVGWNETAVQYPKDVALGQLVEEQVKRTSDAVAAVFEHSSITYRDLNERANQLAHELRKHGAGPDQLVGVYLERSVDMIAALLAVVKAGAAYVPLDPDLPAGRLGYMIEDSGMQILLTQRELRSSLSAFAGTMIEVDSGGWQSNSRENPSVTVTAENLAYVIYTSGSTGKPKGVQVPRGALTNVLWSMKEWLKPEAGQAMLAATTISFDIAGLEIWLPLLVGGHVVVVSRETAVNGEELAAVMKRQDVRLAQATPVTWQLLLNSGWAGKFDLVAICTGEAMPREVAAELRRRVGCLWNLYGPTETTIWSTGFHVEKGDEPVLIGRPIANTQCYILDEQRQPVPVGVVGELYIGGDGLARGYLNRPELTEEKFVPNPFIHGKRMYRTGDLARYRADGNIECLGRTDHQVKIRGCRIELGEIENVLDSHPGVRQSVVVAREDRPGDERLVAYFLPSGTVAPNRSELRALLKRNLPDYMMPADYVVLDSIPFTPNGKVDRLALRALERTAFLDAASYVPPEDAFERLICEAWADVLGLKRVGVRDNFFDLGGHSLSAVQLMLRLQEIIPGDPLSLRALLEAPTVEEFAVLLRNHRADEYQCLVRMRPGSSERPPFFCVHGAGGNVQNMRALAMALPADLPFYCFQDRGLDGSEPFESIEETARCYVDEIRRVQPHGPYYIGGTCYGGRVAFEMARRLEELGEPVAVLVLIDSFNFAFVRSLSKRERFFRTVRFSIRRVAWHARRMLSQHPGEWPSHISGPLRALRRRLRNVAELPATNGADFEVGAGTHLDENLKRVIQANIISQNQCVPKPYSGGALIFRASANNLNPYDDYHLGWGSVVRGGIECFEIKGHHMSILEEPAVRLIAEKLDAKLMELSFGNRSDPAMIRARPDAPR